MDTFQSPYLPTAAKEPEINPTFSQILSSNFNLENDVVNWYDYLTTSTFKPDPAFDFMKTFKASKLPPSFGEYLAPANSQAEYDMLLAKTQKEMKDKAVSAAGGWTSTLTQLAAGVLSPAIFMPFAGQARGGMAFAEVLGLAAAGSTGQNMAMYLNQTTRTEAELYSGIAMDTLLGGMLGGAWLGLSKEGRSRLIADMAANQDNVTLPGGTPDLPQPGEVSLRDPNAPDVPVFKQPFFAKQADPVRDAPATKAATIEAPPLPNTVRVYHSGVAGEGETGRWVSTSRTYAENYRGDLPFYYTDLPKSDPRVNNPDYPDTQGVDQGFTFNFELKPEEAVTLKETYRGLDEVNPQQDLLGTGMADDLTAKAIPDAGLSARDAESVGAAVTRTRNTQGVKRAPNRARQEAMDAIGIVNPAYQMLNNKFFPSLRDGMAKLDMVGLQQAGLDKAEPSASGGFVGERILGYEPAVNKFFDTLSGEFYKYYYDGATGPSLNSPAFAQLRSHLMPTDKGKMNWHQFKEAVADGTNTGEFAPELKASVQALQDFYKFYDDRHTEYLDEFATNGVEVEPLYTKLTEEDFGKGTTGYINYRYDQSAMMNDFQGFLDDFSKHHEADLNERFANAHVKYGKKKAALELEESYNNLGPDGVTAKLEEVEGDLEFLEEIPEWMAFRQQRLDMNKQAKDEGWSKEELAKQRKDMQEAAPDYVKELQAERATLMKNAKTLRNLGGDANTSIDKVKADIAKADELISGMFRETIPALERVDLSIAGLQKSGDKMMAKATSDIKKVVVALGKRQKQMSKLLLSKRANSASRERVQAYLDGLAVKYQGMQERLTIVEGKQLAIDDRLSELNLLREDAVRDVTQLVRGRAARANDLEDKMEKAEAKVVTPEERQRIKDQIGEEILNHERDFEAKWSGLGNVSGKIVEGVADFKDRSIELATLMHQKLTNSEVELSPSYKALREDKRGSELMRAMKLPYEMQKKWLVRDAEMLARMHDYTMAPDLEIWRAFDGSVNGRSLLGQMQEELTAHMVRIGTMKYVKLPKGWADKAAGYGERVNKRLAGFGEGDDLFIDAKNFSNDPSDGFVEITPELRTQLGNTFKAAAKQQTYNFDIAIQRLRGLRGRPRDSNAFWWRTGRFIKNSNVYTMMGGVVPSSINDLARPIQKYGIEKVFRHSWKPYIASLTSKEPKNFRVMSKDINRQLGLNYVPSLVNNAQGLFEMADDAVSKTRLEKVNGFIAQKMGIIALFEYWTAAMKSMSGNVMHATMAEYVPKVAKSIRDGIEPTGDELVMRTYLRNHGLRDLDIHRIAMQMERPDGVEYFSNGGVLPNIGNWDDTRAYASYQAAVLSGVNNMIVRPGLEKPNIVDENMLTSLVFQFKGFTWASNSRVTMSSLQGNDPYLIQGIAFSLAFGALSYYAYAQAAGGKILEKANEGDAGDWAWQAVQRSGISGVLSLPADFGSRIPSVTGRDTNMAFSNPSGVLGSAFGPTMTQLYKLADYLVKMGADDPKQQERNLKTLRQVFVPFQNHFLFRRLLDSASQAMYGN